MQTNYIDEDVPGGVPLKMWTRGVPVDEQAKGQLGYLKEKTPGEFEKAMGGS